MPELVEVECLRRFILRHVQSAIVQEVYLTEDANSLFDEFNQTEQINKLKERVILNVARYGKYLWLQFNPEIYLILHFGMSGSMVLRTVAGEYEFPNVGKNYISLIQDWPSPYAKLRLCLQDGSELAFLETRKFGKIMISEQDPMKHPFVEKLGFDPLATTPTRKQLYDAIQEQSNNPIKTVLLNGKVIAGIGNWMADEILYLAKIHPLQKACDLCFTQVNSLWNCTRQVVEQGIQKDKKIWRERGIAMLKIGGRTCIYVPREQKLQSSSKQEPSLEAASISSSSTDESVKKRSKKVQKNSNDNRKKETKLVKELYDMICSSKEIGITKKDLWQVKEMCEIQGDWDESLVQDAIQCLSSNGSSISFEDFQNIYRQVNQ
eukprot:jgi/Galph1/2214/GphlegSOOS_G875.1